jgi:hypothetical protein
VERRKSSLKTLELTYSDSDRFIINLVSHSSPLLYRQLSDVPVEVVDPLKWIDVMHDGLLVWGTPVEKKGRKASKKKSKLVASTSRTVIQA